MIGVIYELTLAWLDLFVYNKKKKGINLIEADINSSNLLTQVN